MFWLPEMNKYDQKRIGVQVGNRATKGYYNISTPSTTRTLAVYQQFQEDERRRVNEVAEKIIVRQTMGEEAAAGFDDAFDGVE